MQVQDENSKIFGWFIDCERDALWFMWYLKVFALVDRWISSTLNSRALVSDLLLSWLGLYWCRGGLISAMTSWSHWLCCLSSIALVCDFGFGLLLLVTSIKTVIVGLSKCNASIIRLIFTFFYQTKRNIYCSKKQVLSNNYPCFLLFWLVLM